MMVGLPNSANLDRLAVYSVSVQIKVSLHPAVFPHYIILFSILSISFRIISPHSANRSPRQATYIIYSHSKQLSSLVFHVLLKKTHAEWKEYKKRGAPKLRHYIHSREIVNVQQRSTNWRKWSSLRKQVFFRQWSFSLHFAPPNSLFLV